MQPQHSAAQDTHTKSATASNPASSMLRSKLSARHAAGELSQRSSPPSAVVTHRHCQVGALDLRHRGWQHLVLVRGLCSSRQARRANNSAAGDTSAWCLACMQQPVRAMPCPRDTVSQCSVTKQMLPMHTPNQSHLLYYRISSLPADSGPLGGVGHTAVQLLHHKPCTPHATHTTPWPCCPHTHKHSSPLRHRSDTPPHLCTTGSTCRALSCQRALLAGGQTPG